MKGGDYLRYQNKLRVYASLLGAEAANASVVLPANPKRVSIFVYGTDTITIRTANGTAIWISAGGVPVFPLFNYQNYGDLVQQQFTVSTGAGEIYFYVSETYIDDSEVQLS